jgi:hypothetical protein
MVHADRHMDKLDMWLILRCSSHFAENLWPCTIGWLAFPFSEPAVFPHMAHAENLFSMSPFQARRPYANLPFALNAQRWQYFLPCSVLVLHVSQELE